MTNAFAFYCLLCLVLFLLSIASRALVEFTRHDLKKKCSNKNTGAYFDVIINSYESTQEGIEMLRALLLFATPAAALCFVSGGLTSPNALLWDSASMWAQCGGCFLLYVAAGYWLPIPIADLFATHIVYHGFCCFRFLSFLALPLSACSKFFKFFFYRLAGISNIAEQDEVDLEEEIRSIVTEGHKEGVIADNARVMIERIMQLDEVTASAVMTPRTEMECLSKDATWDEMLDFVNSTQLSRIPVYNGSRDDIIGVLFSKDLLAKWKNAAESGSVDWISMMHAPVFVPETKPVQMLLQEFLRNRSHFAIVLDEYGGVAGVVTLEDILEEIVGEITDETDEEPQKEIIPNPDGSFNVLGRTRIDELNSQLQWDIPDDGDYETIGGLILTLLGCIPKENASISLDKQKIRLTVLKASARKIESVKIERENGVE
ncbi:MAG: hemolysin family protein [Planctomycetia bacterium]|nr:hemolysin family protein [Planctomycetia bacterium]